MITRALTRALLLTALPALLAACGGTDATGSTGTGGTGGTGGAPATCAGAPVQVSGFDRLTLDSDAHQPAYASVGDLNGDGRPDLVVSQFGPVMVDTSTGKVSLTRGRVAVYYQGDQGLRCWEKVEILTEDDGIYFPNSTVLADVDADGDLDVILSAGFFVCGFDKNAGDCGAVAWLENPGRPSAAWTRHDVVPYGDDHFYHRAVFVDFDGDGVGDLVTVGEALDGPKAKWFKGTTSGNRFDESPLPIGDGLGSFPQVLDVDGDGDLDVAAAEFFVEGGSFAWFERTAAPSAAAPGGQWARHVINDDSQKGLMLEVVPNLYGDGALHAVGTNHTNTQDMPPDPVESAVFAFDRPADPRSPWPKHQISSGIASRPSQGYSVMAAPGVFGHGDVDGDGDVDLVVSGDGDAHTYWLEQTSPGSFTTHVIEEKLGQAGGALVADLDGDGKNEVVFTGYEDNVVYIYYRAK